MSLAGIKAGDTVIVTDVNRAGQRREICKAVGRKYATIDGKKYEIDSGVAHDDYGHQRAYTEAAWARRQLDLRLWAARVALPDAIKRAAARMGDAEAGALLADIDAMLVRLR